MKPSFSTNASVAIAAAVLLLFSICTAAGSTDVPSAVGRWRTIDDVTNTPRSIVEITQDANGELEGKIVKTFPRPGDKPNPVCEKCQGQRKNQPIVGMVILWGLKPSGAEWSGGSVLDPGNGKTYRAKIRVGDNGRTLTVRGYIGISLLGRSQTWLRDDFADTR